MFTVRRESVHGDEALAENTTTIAYRRTSIPQIIPGPPTVTPVQFYTAARRTPFAPLSPQGAQVPIHSPLPDDHMSHSSSSSPFVGYPHGDPQQGLDHATDVMRYTIGKPISSNRMSVDEFSSAYLAPRRRSIPSHSLASSIVPRSLPPTQQRRRPSNSSSGAVSSTRRPSLPTIHLHQTTTNTLATLPSLPSSTFALPPPPPGSEDIYSNLSSFTFGTAAPSGNETRDTISPFTTPSGGETPDCTPRPSVSGRLRTPRPQHRNIEDDGARADDEDEEEAARQTRAKMRAIDDGTRRPSLPINTYTSDAATSSSSASSKVRPPRSPTEVDVEHDQSDGSILEDEGDLDTDVEFDYVQRGGSQDPETASHLTFGHYSLTDNRMSVDGELADEDLSSQESVSPVRFSSMYDSDSMESSILIAPSSINGRRGSLPWAIPGTIQKDVVNGGRGREDSVATVILPGRRMSRSLGEGEHPLSSTDPTAQSTSQPFTRADWRTLEAQSRAPEQQSNTERAEDQNEDEAGRQVYQGFDMSFVLDDMRKSSWSSEAPSYVQPIKQQPDNVQQPSSTSTWDFSGWGLPIGGGRRPSVMTLGSEDAFLKTTKMYDPTYEARKVAWSFKCDAVSTVSQTTPSAVPGETPRSVSRVPGTRYGTNEVWKQEYVGRFKADKVIVQPADPSKATQLRLNIRHIPDSGNRGIKRCGPTTVIHKHSKAIAFSIFRKHNLFNRGRATSYHMNTAHGILLAPRRVQEQFTNTQSTSQLNSHGHLREARAGNTTRPSVSTSHRSDAPRASHSNDLSKKGKSKGYMSSSSQTTSGGSTTSMDEGPNSPTTDGSSKRKPHSPSLHSVPVSPTVIEYAYPPNHSSTLSIATSNTTTTLRSGRTPSPLEFAPSSSNASMSSLVQSPSTTVRSPQSAHPVRAPLPSSSMMLDEDEQTFPRTSHAEAFATLDSTAIEYYRGRTEQRTTDHESSSLSDRVKRLLGSSNKSLTKPASGPPPTILEPNYHPPWVTMAPRPAQEEKQRVMQNLNDSFKDVGLLPSKTSRPNKSDKSKSKSKSSQKIAQTVNVFSGIPAEALQMLLPLWPGETDAISAHEEGNIPPPELVLDQRQYLLVYYLPFEKHGKESEKDKDKKGESNKKRARPEQAPGGNGASRLPFRVCARLATHADFHGTGVRIPGDGLAITGPIAEAMHFLPPDNTHHFFEDIVIAYCTSRESGMEFVPEGLTKLGLCIPLNPTSPTPSDEDERDVLLTPIGRAVVEMAWLGCMAITSFGPLSALP